MKRIPQNDGVSGGTRGERRPGVPRHGLPLAVLHGAVCHPPSGRLPGPLARAAQRPRPQDSPPPASVHGESSDVSFQTIFHKNTLKPMTAIRSRGGSSVYELERIEYHSFEVSMMFEYFSKHSLEVFKKLCKAGKPHSLHSCKYY